MLCDIEPNDLLDIHGDELDTLGVMLKAVSLSILADHALSGPLVEVVHKSKFSIIIHEFINQYAGAVTVPDLQHYPR